jgi:tetratricopeptide (TPR) repeat protein
MTLGQIYQGTGRYAQAVEAFGAVRPKSSKYLEARTRLGAAHWAQSQALRRDGKAVEADAEVKKAVETLQAALKARQDTGAPATDPALIGNACDLADVYLDTSRPEDALKLLAPLMKGQTSGTGAAYARLVADMLRAHIGTNQVDDAMADMAALEKAGGSGAGLTQLYYGLGKLLQKQMDALEKKGDKAGKERTRAAYLRFLNALAESKSGQTYDSLEWAGEQMLALDNPKEAEGVFQRILKAFESDPKFQTSSGPGDRVLRTRLKLAAALRGQGNFEEAEKLGSMLLQENPNKIAPLMEKGMLVEDQAAATERLKGSDRKKVPWSAAFAQWRTIAMRLGTGRTKPLEYYEAWYHAAYALNKDKKPKEARQTLGSIMRLSASVGGPEMKQKYKALLDQLK